MNGKSGTTRDSAATKAVSPTHWQCSALYPVALSGSSVAQPKEQLATLQDIINESGKAAASE